jgi:non-ribosomal peptide synthetase component F
VVETEDEIAGRLEAIDLRQEGIYRKRSGNPEYIGSGSDLVYVIYTSGSTGKPLRGFWNKECALSLIVLNECGVVRFLCLRFPACA